MKKILTLAVLPFVLFALETVNLIKDASFEKDSEVWGMYTEADGEYDSTQVNRLDSEDSHTGNHSGSIDTRIEPADGLPNLYRESGYLSQILTQVKSIMDLDTLELNHKLLYPEIGIKAYTDIYSLRLMLSDITETEYVVLYEWLAPGLSPAPETPTIKHFSDTMGDEDTWLRLYRDIITDAIDQKGLPSNLELDSIVFYSGGIHSGGIWRGQKVFFDGIRLMGYADYDVGIKEILSGNELEVDSPYTPIARIKNFGREDAEEFNVIAEVWDGESLIYEETISHTLPGDTEDTLEFPPFTPTYMTTYTLTIRTEMVTPAIDECDEDDQLSKTIGQTGITDDPSTPVTHLSIEVQAITSTLLIDYSLPADQPASLSVFDATGRLIEHLTVTGAGSVNIPELTSGVYFVRLDACYLILSEKVVVSR